MNGTTISATTWHGSPVTVIVSAGTRYREAAMSASLSDVHVGSMIVVHGTRTGTNTIEASDVMMLQPRLAGVVTAVNGSTLTATGFDSVSHIITVHDQTRYERAGHVATLAEVTVGTAIVAEGAPNSDGSFSAVAVMIQVPHVIGQVTAVNGSVITVSRPFGRTYTVITSANTTYTAPGNTPASASSVRIGTLIGAEGTLSADRKTLSALRIMVLPRHPSCMSQHDPSRSY